MPIDLTKENAPLGNIIYQWDVREYERHERGRRWYVVMGIIAVLMIGYAVVSANYLFVLIVVLFGIVLYLHDVQEPIAVPFAITDTGIILGRKYYRYSELVGFWILYKPPEVKNLYFTLNNLIRHRLQVPLLEYDPRPIRDFLNQYMTEDLDQEDEPLSDRLGRLLKLH